MFKQIDYKQLNSKQKEIHNFQKVSAVLADYGFNCIKLADDWNGADFLAYHADGVQTLRVQLKGRITIKKSYSGKDLFMCFPIGSKWCVVPHDALVELVGRWTPWIESSPWLEKGEYHAAQPSKQLAAALSDFVVG